MNTIRYKINFKQNEQNVRSLGRRLFVKGRYSVKNVHVQLVDGLLPLSPLSIIGEISHIV